MTFQYGSDLHLEFPENYDYLKKFPIEPKADVLILAGDIVTFGQLEKRMDFFNYISDNFEQVYWIPGNHEYYYGDIARCCGPHQEQIKNNVELVNNITIKTADYDLVFSTMWSHISLSTESRIFDGLSDFYVIRNSGQVFKPTDYNKLHQEGLDFIQGKISNENGQQKIVVTHHYQL